MLYLRNCRGEKIIRGPGGILGEGVTVQDLTDCDVYLLDRSQEVLLEKCCDSDFVIGPCQHLTIRGAENCVISAVCYQFEAIDCNGCEFQLFSSSAPLIKRCNRVTFSCWNTAYPQLDVQFQAAGLDARVNMWSQVLDQSADDPSLPCSHFSIQNKPAVTRDLPLQGFGPCSNPVVFHHSDASCPSSPLVVAEAAQSLDAVVPATRFSDVGSLSVSEMDEEEAELMQTIEDIPPEVTERVYSLASKLDMHVGGTIGATKVEHILLALGDSAQQAREESQKMTQNGPLPVEDMITLWTQVAISGSIQILDDMESRMEMLGLDHQPASKACDDTDFCANGLASQRVTVNPGEVDGGTIELNAVTNSEVFVCDFSGRARLQHCHKSKIFIGPVQGVFRITNCSDCVVTVACGAFAAESCHNVIFRLFVGSPSPSVSYCSNLTFTWWNGAYPKLAEHVQSARLHPEANYWWDVVDLTPASGQPDSFMCVRSAEQGAPVDWEQVTLVSKDGNPLRQVDMAIPMDVPLSLDFSRDSGNAKSISPSQPEKVENAIKGSDAFPQLDWGNLPVGTSPSSGTVGSPSFEVHQKPRVGKVSKIGKGLIGVGAKKLVSDDELDKHLGGCLVSKKDDTPSSDECVIKDLANETVFKRPGSFNGGSLQLSNLKGCKVFVLDYTSNIICDECEDCTLFFGPVDGSCFLRNLANCQVTVPCRQFRTRECSNCTFYLYCFTKSPVVEMSSKCVFSSYNGAYPLLPVHMAAAKLDPSVSFWDDIFDFSANDPSFPSPHFTIRRTRSSLNRVATTDVDGNDIGPPQSMFSGNNNANTFSESSFATKRPTQDVIDAADVAAPPRAGSSLIEKDSDRDMEHNEDREHVVTRLTEQCWQRGHFTAPMLSKAELVKWLMVMGGSQYTAKEADMEAQSLMGNDEQFSVACLVEMWMQLASSGDAEASSVVYRLRDHVQGVCAAERTDGNSSSLTSANSGADVRTIAAELYIRAKLVRDEALGGGWRQAAARAWQWLPFLVPNLSETGLVSVDQLTSALMFLGEHQEAAEQQAEEMVGQGPHVPTQDLVDICTQLLLDRSPEMVKVVQRVEDQLNAAVVGEDGDQAAATDRGQGGPRIGDSATGGGGADCVAFANIEGERAVKRAGSVRGGAVRMFNLNRADAYVLDYSSQVDVFNVMDSRIFVGPVNGTVSISNARNCTITAVCRCLQITDCFSCEFRVFCSDQGPTMQRSCGCVFTYWNGSYPQLGQHLRLSGIDPNAVNLYNKVLDLNDGDDTWAVPHYAVVEEGPDWDQVVPSTDCNGQDIGPPENPIPEPTPVKKEKKRSRKHRRTEGGDAAAVQPINPSAARPVSNPLTSLGLAEQLGFHQDSVLSSAQVKQLLEVMGDDSPDSTAVELCGGMSTAPIAVLTDMWDAFLASDDPDAHAAIAAVVAYGEVAQGASTTHSELPSSHTPSGKQSGQGSGQNSLFVSHVHLLCSGAAIPQVAKIWEARFVPLCRSLPGFLDSQLLYQGRQKIAFQVQWTEPKYHRDMVASDQFIDIQAALCNLPGVQLQVHMD